MPAKIEFINTELHTHTGEVMKYIIYKLEGKKINYHFALGRVIKREITYYKDPEDEKVTFNHSTLIKIFEKENCQCEFIKSMFKF